jgi:RNA polymerase sigma-70 factor, ECF subfamily
MSERPEDRLARLLHEHGAALSRLAAVYEWDQQERQDLLQEIALAVWRALPSFRGESTERTFVFRIAHNRGLSHRWRQRRSHLDLEHAEEIPDQRAGPEARLAHREQQERLAAAIRRLPDSYRAPVVLTLEGLTQREVADVLGAKENTIAVRLTRARRMLRELLGEEKPSP